MKEYILASIIIQLLLGITWSKEGLINILVKIALIGLGLIGLVQYLILIGYIIKH